MNWTKTKFASALTLAIATLFAGVQAQALEPAVSSMVDTVTPAAPNNYRQEDDTIYLGIAECRGSIGIDTKLTGTFEMNLDPQEETGGVQRFENAYFFSVPRNQTSGPTCPESCVLIDSDEEVIFGADPFFVRARVQFEDLVGITTADECEGFDNEYFVRVQLRRNLNDADTSEDADTKFVIDTIRPTPPANYEATVTQNQLSVTWELAADDDIEKYGVYWSTTEFTGGQLPEGQQNKFFTSEGGRTSGTADVSFDPGTTVYVAMVSADETGNNSILGNVVSTSVIETKDFWDSYQEAGGAETGGCSTTPAIPGEALPGWMMVILGFAGLGLRRRR